MTAFRRKFADAKSLNFANPARLAHSLRVVLDSGTKSVKGISVLNNRLEMISNNSAAVTEGDRSADENLSARVQLSGSIHNVVELTAMWNELKANVDAAIADGALNGFLPTNAVFNVVARS